MLSVNNLKAQRNSLSNSPCPLGRARGRGRYNLLARAINNKPFQCSDGRNSLQRRRTAARVRFRTNKGICSNFTLRVAHARSFLLNSGSGSPGLAEPGPGPA